MNIKLINITHKPCRIFDVDYIITMNAGRAIAESKSKDGYLSNEELKWLEENTLSDASGDNISKDNRYYNEMTAIYWIWKNYKKIGIPDAIGFMHYRRHFILKDTLKITGNYLEDLGITEENLNKLMNKYDIISPFFVHTKKKSFINQIGEEFCTLGGERIKYAVLLALEIIKERDPSNFPKIYSVLHGHQTGSFCNMFIMKKELFFEYCEWLFPVLFELDKRLGRSYKEKEERCLGWMAEMLTSIFIYLQTTKHHHKQVFVFNQDPNNIKSFKKILILKLKYLFLKKKKYLRHIYNYTLFKKYCKKEK